MGKGDELLVMEPIRTRHVEGEALVRVGRQATEIDPLVALDEVAFHPSPSHQCGVDRFVAPFSLAGSQVDEVDGVRGIAGVLPPEDPVPSHHVGGVLGLGLPDPRTGEGLSGDVVRQAAILA